MSNMSRGRKPPSQQSLRNPANRIKKGGKKKMMKKMMSDPKPIKRKRVRSGPVKEYTV